MVLQYEWQSFQGTLTDDNRDYCGIAERLDATLYAVIDGSTRGPHGGDLAKELACNLIDKFIALDKPATKPDVLAFLEETHKKLRFQYPADSASYFILIQTGESQVMIIYAGDCRLGRLKQDQSIDWLTTTHTLANAITDLSDEELSSHPNRHLLTRSFRPQCFIQPEYCQFSLLPNDTLVIATDGFWAELDSAMQTELLKGNYAPSEQIRDDRSYLLLQRRPLDLRIEMVNKINNQENIYIRSHLDTR